METNNNYEICPQCGNLSTKTFLIKYINSSSLKNGEEFRVREIEGEDYHYFISDGKSHVGGGRLLKKYCVKI